MKIRLLACLCGVAVCFGSLAEAVDVILSGGVALKSWEHLRGPASQHDKWWANFIRSATNRIDDIRGANPRARIVWIVYRPAYKSRGREDGEDYISKIRREASRRGVRLVWADTATEAVKAINAAPRGRDKVTSFTYFGHSNRFAFMLDYSNTIMAASRQWIHEDDLAGSIRKDIFAPNADCRSYGCYTGNSMSKKWKAAFGVPLLGNTESTLYYPITQGKMPEGAGEWVR